jgi:hypothetical protein
MLMQPSIGMAQDTTLTRPIRSTKADTVRGLGDTLRTSVKGRGGPRVKFLPVAKRSLTLSLLLPGAGQIYNRSYWKAPIVWGLLATSCYFIADNQIQANNWNSIYKQTLKTDDPNRPAISSTGARANRDFYLRNRDIAILALVATYGLTAMEAFVDAHLKGFTVSENLTIKIGPSMPLQTASSLAGPWATRNFDLTKNATNGLQLPIFSNLSAAPTLQVFAGMKFTMTW